MWLENARRRALLAKPTMTEAERERAIYVIDLILDFYLPSIARHTDGGGMQTREIWQKIRAVVKGGEKADG
jgi:hypothetical protein